jgi:chaperonin cofactor prefoldin
MDCTFEKLKEELKSKKETLKLNEQCRSNLKNEIKDIETKLQKICKHIYVKEEISGGAYGEMYNICIKCNKW